VATKVFAVGLPGTGKTTFLAAFWDSLQTPTGQRLTLSKTEGDMEYLNEIRAAWADCKPLPRTGPAGDRPVSMRITAESSESMQVVWTDMLGESFSRQWVNRNWTQGYQDLVDAAQGAILFLHPSETWEEPLIHEADELLEEEESVTLSEQPTNTEQPIPFDPESVPTQVKVVELLQFIAARRGNASFRLAIVISAWDLAKPDTTDPQSWLLERMPMLDSYLRFSGGGFQYRVFGVSAQGGDYSNANELRQVVDAAERVKVENDEGCQRSISDPVCWALGLEEGEVRM